MALVVLLRGVNVGGHKTFRPTVLARHLKHFGAVNIGAAGTYVIRKPTTRGPLRAELRRRLPFDTEIVMCDGKELLGIMADNPFVDQPKRPDIVHFVSVLSRRPRSEPALPISYPPDGMWLVRILARKDRFVFGQYRRHMKTIGYLGQIDRLYDVPLTTRNWNTITAIAKVVGNV